MNTKGKILIIDDNEDVLFALNLLLEPYVEKIKVTTQPTRIEHFMTTFQPDVIHYFILIYIIIRIKDFLSAILQRYCFF